MIITLLTVMLSLGAASYYAGMDGGVTFNTVIAGTGYRSYEYDWGTGYRFSFPFVVTFNDNIALETGLAMYGKNYRYFQNTESGSVKQTNFDLTVENGFISFPLLLRYYLPLGNFDFYTAIGGWMGVWVYGSREGFVVNANSKKESVDEKTNLSLYNRFDAGAALKLGVDVDFGSCRAYVEGEYGLSLTDMNKNQKHASYPVHNSTFSVTFGCLMEVGK